MSKLFPLYYGSPVGEYPVSRGTKTLLARANKIYLMKNLYWVVSSLFLLSLCLGVARAVPSDTVTQTITIKLDKRFGLHLHNSTWTVNLGSGTGTAPGSSVATSNCYRAGFHNSATGRDELYTVGTSPNFLNLFNYARFSGDTLQDNSNPYSRPVNTPGSGKIDWFSDLNQTVPETRIVPVSSYPGFEVNSGALVWAGPSMCILNTTLEVFSNQQSAGGVVKRSAVYASLISATNFPKLVINVSNAVTPGAKAAFMLPNATPGVRLATRSGPVRWTDFPLIQALVFDGSETSASSGTATLTFTLADVTAP